MPDASLVIPFLIDPPIADPLRLASSTPDRLKAGWTSERHGLRAAVVDRYNSLWIYLAESDKGKRAVRDDDEALSGPGDRKDGVGRDSLSISVPDITLNTSTPPHGNAVSAGSSRNPTPTTPTFSSGNAPGPSRLHRPSQLRSHSSASMTYGNLSRDPAYNANHRSRAASNASSILSSSSHYRRSSALSPPAGSPRIGTTALSAETAQADPHAGHRHARSSSLTSAAADPDSGNEQQPRASTSSHRQLGEAAARPSISETELLDQLKHQCRPLSPAGDRGIGLGIGFGSSGRGLALGSRSTADSPHTPSAAPSDSESAGPGAISPRSTHSTESSRTLSNRFLPWRSGDDEVSSTREREKVLMEKVAEVEVEREMEREVQEEEKERAEEKLVRDARETVTPRGSMVIEEAGHDTRGSGQSSRRECGTKRILLPGWTRGRVVRCRVVQDMQALMVLRDTGVLDMISLDTEQHVSSVQLEREGSHANTAAAGANRAELRLCKFWHWLDLDILAVGPDRVIIAHGLPWSSGGMPSPNGQVTRVVMLRSVYPHSTYLESLAQVELAGVGGVSVDTQGVRMIHHLPTGTLAYPILSPSTHTPSDTVTAKPLPTNNKAQTQHRSVSALHPSAASSSGSTPNLGSNGSPLPQDGLRRHRSQLLPRGAQTRLAHGPNGSGGGSGNGVWGREGERGFAKFLGIKKEEVKDNAPVEVGWGVGAAVELPDAALVNGVDEDETPGTSPSGREAAHRDSPNTDEDPSAISGIVPFDIETCFVADRNGEITKQRFTDVLSGDLQPAETPTVDRLPSLVTSMTVVRPHRDEAYLVAGDEDGMLRIWDAQSFELLAMLSLFAFPVVSIHMLDMPQAGTLRGQLLCTSKLGTIALVSLDEMDQSFLIPASRDALRRLFVGGKDMMMIYANGKARVWNVETLEFRRSTALDAAEDMLNAGQWHEIDIVSPSRCDLPLRNTSMQIVPGAASCRLLELDLRRLGAWLRQQRSSNAGSIDVFDSLLAMLPLFLTPGLDGHIDGVCEKGLGVRWARNPVLMGDKSQSTSAVVFSEQHGLDVWRESAEATGTRQLAIVALLRPFLDSQKYEASAAQIIAYYTAALPADAIDADLRFFARYYLDSSNDIHLAARILFDSRMDRMPAEEVEQLAEEYISSLPSQRPTGKVDVGTANMALTVLGGMALHRYQNISPAALKSVAESITLYLASDDPSRLGLAIELASKGFSTWQTFIDPAEMLRRLFYLSTHNLFSTSDGPSGASGVNNSSIAAQARLAVLHVASTNPALFMSTLSMDILDARTVEGRKSIMKLCVYMARKKPEVLENSLPKVVEAVVKSLDPNVGKMREDVQQTATVILSELVLAFSTVDFHSASQRLAMGTREGAVIMYDLKTASRLYVLEPHKHPVSAVMFSPDGRRLVTVSLEEGDITVWKVGSSLSGFFNVGGPPRQGGEKGEPFKRIEFARADDGPLKSTTALSDIQITWPGQKQVKVVIRETALSFEA